MGRSWSSSTPRTHGVGLLSMLQLPLKPLNACEYSCKLDQILTHPVAQGENAALRYILRPNMEIYKMYRFVVFVVLQSEPNLFYSVL